MKIANSTVNMAATSKLDISSTRQTTLQAWVGNRPSTTIRNLPAQDADSVDISFLAKKLSLKAIRLPKEGEAKPLETAMANGAAATDGDLDLTDKDMQKIKMIEEFMYRLTGKRFRFLMVDKNKLQELAKKIESGQAAPLTPIQAAPQRAGYGIIYDSVETYSEQQTMAFTASGSVQTADGRSIDFNVTMRMSRSFYASSEIHYREGDAKIDPLVIKVDGAGPRLTQRDFLFDLDNDGDQEQISRLLTGSGFLALDKNEDGVINNGGELFGPAMGDGFAELAQYDSDGNRWIDENDAIYDKLRIWMADENGEMKLFALGQKGIGALYLGNVASAFDIRDTGNNSLGTVQSTGIYLKENGQAGTLQHIDLTV